MSARRVCDDMHPMMHPPNRWWIDNTGRISHAGVMDIPNYLTVAEELGWRVFRELMPERAHE